MLDLQRCGIVIPDGATFFEFIFGKQRVVGMQVGQYTHQCAIDVSDFAVLLYRNPITRAIQVIEYDKFFLRKL